jgi:tRNA 2-thiouridine synthesizing protein A
VEGIPQPDLVPDLIVDCTGLRCPLPVIHLARRLSEVPVGGVVEVRADDPAARLDIQAWCRMRQHAYLGEHASQPDGVPGYWVRRAS